MVVLIHQRILVFKNKETVLRDLKERRHTDADLIVTAKDYGSRDRVLTLGV